MRVNLKLAADNFAKFGFAKADYWDRAAEHSAYQIRLANELDRMPADATAEHRAAARQRCSRKLPTHFGAFATMTLQPLSAKRKAELKQFADRATAVLYLGTDASGRYIVVDRRGAIHNTIDVNFITTMPQPLLSNDDDDDDDAWIETATADAAADVARQLAFPGHTTDDEDDVIQPLDVDAPPDEDNNNVDTDDDDADVESALQYAIGDKVSANWNGTWYDGIITACSYAADTVGHTDTVDVYFPGDHTVETYTGSNFADITFVSEGNESDTNAALQACDSESDDDATPVVLAARRTTPFVPHPSVAEYINASGQIRHELLRGTAKLPNAPPLPPYTSDDHPPPPKTVLDALAGTDAIHWLHAIIAETVGHITVAHTFRTAPLCNMPEFNNSTGKWSGVKGTWALTYKWAGDGVQIARFKAREAMGAHRHAVQAGVHYDVLNTFSSNAPMSDLRNLEVIAVEKELDRREIDVERAYLQALISPRPDGNAITMRQPEGTRMHIDATTLQPTTEAPDTADHDIEGTHVTNASMTFTNDSDNAIEAGNIVDKSWYGWPTGGSDWSNKLTRTLTGKDASKAGACPFQIKQCTAQPCIYYINDPGFPDTFFVIWTQTDNLRLYSSSTPAMELFLAWIRGTFPITGGEAPLQDQPATTCVGTQFLYTPDTLQLSNAAFIERLLAEYNLADCNVPTLPMTPGFTLQISDRPETDAERTSVTAMAAKLFPTKEINTYTDACTVYRRILMSISWYAGQTGPTMRLAVSQLAKGMQFPCEKGFKALKAALRFTKNGITNPLEYRKTKEWAADEWPQLEFGSDASFNDDPDTSKSQGGYVGRFEHQAASTFVSKQSATVVTSTYQAETHFASLAAKEIVYQRAVLNEIGATQTGPTPLYVDNAAAVLDVNCRVRKFSKKNKHFSLQERYARQCSEQGEIKMIKTPGAALDADSMTKALPRVPFNTHHATLHYGDRR